MQSEILEKILIDYDLGELPADTEELLQAYLRLCPERVETAAAVAGTIRLTRAAFRSEYAEEIEELPAPSFLRAAPRRASRRRHAWVARFATAAAILLAFWIGLHSGSPIAAPSIRANPPAQSLSGARAARNDGFWSRKHLHETVSMHRPTTSRNIVWPGPIARPQPGASS